MRRNLASRVERLENKTDHSFDRMIPVVDAEEAAACRAWWRKENPGAPDSRLLIVITGVPRANREPWDSANDR